MVQDMNIQEMLACSVVVEEDMLKDEYLKTY